LAPDSALAQAARLRRKPWRTARPSRMKTKTARFAAGDLVHKDFGIYGAGGENIMMERDPSRAFDAEAFRRRAVASWMGSEGHRANILSRDFARSGIGVAVNGSYVYATQIFWGPPTQIRWPRAAGSPERLEVRRAGMALNQRGGDVVEELVPPVKAPADHRRAIGVIDHDFHIVPDWRESEPA